MIIFGTRSSKFKTIPANGTCPSCGNEQSMMSINYQRYFHIFWIPIFPTSRQHFCGCNSCGASWELNRNDAQSITGTKIGTPWWSFLGLLIVPVFIISALISGQIEGKNSDKWITEPLVGDVYEYRTDDSLFSIMKVCNVSNDSVYLYSHQSAVKKSNHVHRLHSMKGDDNLLYYTDKEDISSISKLGIIEMKESGVILSVKRN